MASLTKVRVSLNTVIDCLPSKMYCTEALAASWPVMSRLLTSLSFENTSEIERAVSSFGARINTLPLSAVLAEVMLLSAKPLAVFGSQPVLVCPMILACSSRLSLALSFNAMASLLFLITNVPSAILGCKTPHAPSKKMKALLSEAAPV